MWLLGLEEGGGGEGEGDRYYTDSVPSEPCTNSSEMSAIAMGAS